MVDAVDISDVLANPLKFRTSFLPLLHFHFRTLRPLPDGMTTTSPTKKNEQKDEQKNDQKDDRKDDRKDDQKDDRKDDQKDDQKDDHSKEG